MIKCFAFSAIIIIAALVHPAQLYATESILIIPEGYESQAGQNGLVYCNRAGYLLCAQNCENRNTQGDNTWYNSYQRCLSDNINPDSVCVERYYDDLEREDFTYSACMSNCELMNCIQLY